MSADDPTPAIVVDTPEAIPGYEYGTAKPATSPLDPEDLERPTGAVRLTADDEAAPREAASILADHSRAVTIAGVTSNTC